MIFNKLFDTGKTGPKIVFFGAIHGNEYCGSLAIKKIIGDLESSSLNLIYGSVLFVPICNQEAQSKNVRFIDEDLNRIFRKTDTPKSHEEVLANELTTFIDQSDILLDIHSMQAEGPVNIFVDFPTIENRKFAKALGAPYAILGWPELYTNKGQGLVSYDTTAYTNKVGKIGILIECGQHSDPKAVDVAYDAIIRTLADFNVISDIGNKSVVNIDMKEITMTDLFIKNAEGDHFVSEWKHLDKVSVGQVIAERETGEKILANYDCVMVLPKLKGLVGREWFYLGKILGFL